jgi:hypothetical protein
MARGQDELIFELYARGLLVAEIAAALRIKPERVILELNRILNAKAGWHGRGDRAIRFAGWEGRMPCRFCEKTRQLAHRAWQHALPHLPHGRQMEPIRQLTISIERGADGDRVWITTTHCVGRWYRIGKVILDDRRPYPP